jgi:multidrug resistance efflux pump
MIEKVIFFIREIKNKKLLFGWISCIIIIVLISMYYKESSGFLGITDAKEIIINYDKAVTLKKLNVYQGQKIKQGELILELESPELEIRMNTIFSELQQLFAQYNFNKELKIENMSGNLQNIKPTNPLNIKIIGFKKELELLQEEKQKLRVNSEVNGTVCSANYKAGEKITPFTPIVSICPESPLKVIGYIHENLYSRIKIGQKVLVKPLADNSRSAEGLVKGVGLRIIPMPDHIKKISGVPLWAREVLIEIPHNNSFLFGEKVSIEVKGNSIISNMISSILH